MGNKVYLENIDNIFSLIDPHALILMHIQSKLFIASLFNTEYSLSDIKMQVMDLLLLKIPLYNRITEYSLNDTDSKFWEQIYIFY